MLDNPRSPRVRSVAKLARKNARQETGLFLLEGPQSVTEALAFRPEILVELFATPTGVDRHPALVRAATEAGSAPILVSDSVLDVMADTVTPQGFVAVARQMHPDLEDILTAAPRLVAILEEVRDPGNAGTVIRAADAAGADAVILTGRSVDPYNPKVVRSTTGSLFHLPVIAGVDLVEVAGRLRERGLQVLAADIGGEDLLTIRTAGVLTGPTAWVFGNEARGLDDDQLRVADAIVRVPVYGRAESLNLATAAAVCLYESAFALRSDVG